MVRFYLEKVISQFTPVYGLYPFDTLYPDYKHIGIAYTTTPDERSEIQYELNLEDFSWTQLIDDTPIVTQSFDYENRGAENALKNMRESMQYARFEDLVYVDSDDLYQAVGLRIDDDGNYYDPLDKDMDNDGVKDRYDHDFRDGDYEESTFDIDGLKKDEKPSILGQIKAYQSEGKNFEKSENKEKTQER